MYLYFLQFIPMSSSLNFQSPSLRKTNIHNHLLTFIFSLTPRRSGEKSENSGRKQIEKKKEKKRKNKKML